jgi:hypothetical protein
LDREEVRTRVVLLVVIRDEVAVNRELTTVVAINRGKLPLGATNVVKHDILLGIVLKSKSNARYVISMLSSQSSSLNHSRL